MKLYSLVEVQAGAGRDSLVGVAMPCEPSLLPENRQLRPDFSVPTWDAAFAEHLRRRIERNPRDLRAHTQRVLMHAGNSDGASTFSALADLFIVLGGNGYELRQTLLHQVTSVLTVEQFQFFSLRMDAGLAVDEQLPGGSYSSLSIGGSENYQLVIKSDASPGESIGNSGLISARQQIAEGRIEQARELLERSLELDPGNRDLCIELLDLYRKHELVDAFRQFYFRLSARSLAEPQRWLELDTHFQQQT